MIRRLFLVGLLLTATACKSMSERGVANISPNPEPTAVTESKFTPLQIYYQSIAKKTKIKVADKDGGRYDRCSDEGDRSSCMKTTCSLGAYNCSYQSQLESVLSLCKRSDGDCVKSVCSQGAFSCSYQSQLEKVVTLCRGSVGDCVKSTCSLGAYNCSYQSQLETVATSCQDVDSRCVTETCAIGAFNCSYQSQLSKVMNLCKAH